MKSVLRLGLASALAGGVWVAPAHSAERRSVCERTAPVVFAAPRAETAEFRTALARRILEDGFGCETIVVDGATDALVAAIAAGDADIIMDVWTDNAPPALAAAEASGLVVRLGTIVPDGRHGWYVPRFAVEGPDAPAAGLTSLAELGGHSAVFRDPEEPDRGRFFNCVIGWACEAEHTASFEEYGLAEAFANVRPGSHEALVEQVEEAIALREPVLFAYWSPSALVARHDLVRLEEPFGTSSGGSPIRGDEGSAPVAVAVDAMANAGFAAEVPSLAAFLGRYRLAAAAVDDAIADMAVGVESADDAAARFLSKNPQIWSAWVPPDVAARVDVGLAGGDRTVASGRKRQPVPK